MFAVVQLGGMQYKVSEGDVIKANRLDYEKDQSVVLDKVLLVSDGKTVKIGSPLVKGAQVKAKIIGNDRADKVVAYHYRKRKDSSVTVGHRQDLTVVKIEKISV